VGEVSHRSWLALFVIDVADLDRAAAFWSAALRGEVVQQPFGVGIYLTVRVPTDAGEATLLMQKVPELKTAKSRVHLDIATDDVDAEIARLEGLGAHRQHAVDERGVHFVVLEDPDGNEFCVIPGRRDDDWPTW
jgi:predicted enzyme related to lactoylglutathione lyase